MQKTWENFTVTRVKSWDNKPFFYYLRGFDDTKQAVCEQDTDEQDLLVAAEQTSQCSGFAALLKGSLGINGIRADRIYVTAQLPPSPTGEERPRVRMMVKSWTVGNPHYQINNPAMASWRWRFATEKRNGSMWYPVNSSGKVERSQARSTAISRTNWGSTART